MILDHLSNPIENDAQKNRKQIVNAYKSTKPNVFIGTSCPYCGNELTKENITRDHVIPLSDRLNLKDALHIMSVCRECNNKKDSKNLLAFIGLLPELRNTANPHEPGIKIDEKSKKLSNLTGLTVKTMFHSKGRSPSYIFFNKAGQSIKEIFTFHKARMFAEGIAFGFKLKENA